VTLDASDLPETKMKQAGRQGRPLCGPVSKSAAWLTSVRWWIGPAGSIQFRWDALTTTVRPLWSDEVDRPARRSTNTSDRL